MTRRAVKIEFEDHDGERYTIKLEGHLSKDKVMKIMDMYELLTQENQDDNKIDMETAYGKIQNIITETLPLRNFTSDEIQELYEDKYNEPIKIATISTYLSRLQTQGSLKRIKHGRRWIYAMPNAIIPKKPYHKVTNI